MEIESNSSKIFTFKYTEAVSLYETIGKYLADTEKIQSLVLVSGTEKKPVPVTFMFEPYYKTENEGEQASFSYDEKTGEIVDEDELKETTSEKKTVKFSEHEIGLFSEDNIKKLAWELGINFVPDVDIKVLVREICKDEIDLDEGFMTDGELDYEKLDEYLYHLKEIKFDGELEGTMNDEDYGEYVNLVEEDEQ